MRLSRAVSVSENATGAARPPRGAAGKRPVRARDRHPREATVRRRQRLQQTLRRDANSARASPPLRLQKRNRAASAAPPLHRATNFRASPRCRFARNSRPRPIAPLICRFIPGNTGVAKPALPLRPWTKKPAEAGLSILFFWRREPESNRCTRLCRPYDLQQWRGFQGRCHSGCHFSAPLSAAFLRFLPVLPNGLTPRSMQLQTPPSPFHATGHDLPAADARSYSHIPHRLLAWRGRNHPGPWRGAA